MIENDKLLLEDNFLEGFDVEVFMYDLDGIIKLGGFGGDGIIFNYFGGIVVGYIGNVFIFEFEEDEYVEQVFECL